MSTTIEEEESSFQRELLHYPEEMAKNPDPRMITFLKRHIDEDTRNIKGIVHALAKNTKCQDAVDLAIQFLFFFSRSFNKKILEILSENPLAFDTLKKHPTWIQYRGLYKNPHPGAIELLKNRSLEENLENLQELLKNTNPEALTILQNPHIIKQILDDFIDNLSYFLYNPVVLNIPRIRDELMKYLKREDPLYTEKSDYVLTRMLCSEHCNKLTKDYRRNMFDKDSFFNGYKYSETYFKTMIFPDRMDHVLSNPKLMKLEKDQIVRALRKLPENGLGLDYMYLEYLVSSPPGYPILEALGSEEQFLLENLAYTPTKDALRKLFHHPNFNNYYFNYYLANILARNPHTLDQHKTWLRRKIFMSTTSRKQEEETQLDSPRVPPDLKIEPKPKKTARETVFLDPSLSDKIASFFGGRRRTRRRRQAPHLKFV